MIVIFIDNLENFIEFLKKRIMNEIFYEFKENPSESDLNSEIKIEIILHFLAKVEGNLILYETKQSINKPSNSNVDKEVINSLNNIFTQVDSSLALVKGKIREIFLSYST
ncbi:MAG: hypothetical protein ACXACC_06220 [Promethearchaeota archaeon]|jgi:hypothetical protein